MKKTINFCGNCPFMYEEFDEYKDDPITIICTLSYNNKQDEYIISEINENKTPDFCPLKKEELILNFKEFSPSRLEKIRKLKTEIESIYQYFDENDFNPDDENMIIKNDELKSLSYNLNELNKNEDMQFQDELTDSINKIQDQLIKLQEVGTKLQETFNNVDLNDE